MAFSNAQNEAIHHLKGPALVLAGPGSGKTTVITNRIRFLVGEAGIDPARILVITFTRAAAQEMRARYEQMTGTGCKGPVFGTFHSVFFTILKYAYRYDASSIVKEEERRGFLGEQARRLGVEMEDESEFVEGVLGEISLVKGEMLGLDCYYPKSCGEDIFRKLYVAYEEWLRTRNLLDFDDMLVMCRELFVARKDILAGWQKRWQYILIDEFQDINRVQYEVVRMLALPENNLFIVGDDDQSIYRFRGAKPEIMLGFEKDYPDARKILLDVNYRSTRPIITCAGHLIEKNKMRFPKNIRDARGEGHAVVARAFANPSEEAVTICEQLRNYRKMGMAWEEMAVLYRTNIGPRRLVSALMEYNIPFDIRDGMPNLYDHWIAQDILAYIRAARAPIARADFLRIMNRPLRYISRDAVYSETVNLESVKSFYQDRLWMLERVEELETDLKNVRDLPPGKAVNYIRKAISYDEFLQEYAMERRMDLTELTEILDQLQEGAMAHESWEAWCEYMDRYRAQLEERAKNKRERSEGVRLMTMHSSKGLEFRVVFLLDANEGVTPHNKAALDADMEEERRMFYVAMTRAKDRLHVYWVRERYHRRQEVSRFVKEAGL